MAKLHNWGLKFDFLPPEFLFFDINIENYEPWTPVDSILMTRLNSFQQTQEWINDLQREVLRQSHPDLNEFKDEICPPLNTAEMEKYLRDLEKGINPDAKKESIIEKKVDSEQVK